MKIWMKACVLALTVMLLAGCSQQTSSAEPIGIDAAESRGAGRCRRQR